MTPDGRSPDQLAEDGLAKVEASAVPSSPTTVLVSRSALVWLAVAMCLMAGVAGLGTVASFIRAAEKGQEAETAQEAVDRSADVIRGLQATVSRLERRLDEAERVAACRSESNAAVQIALGRALQFVLTPDTDRDPDTLVGIRGLLDDALARRQAQSDAPDPCSAITEGG